jgi:hypothetical protein
MRLAFNMANLAKDGFLSTVVEESHYLIKKSCAEA